MTLVSINFILRTDKQNKHGQRPIVMTVSVAGSLKKYPTGLNIFSENWDQVNKRVAFLNSKTAKSLSHIDPLLLPMQSEVIRMNDQLSVLKKKVNDIAMGFQLENRRFTVLDVIDSLSKDRKLQSKLEPSKYLYEFIDQYIITHEKVRQKGSLGVYKSLKKHLNDFQKEANIKVSFDSINYKFFELFQNHLLQKNRVVGGEKQGLSNTTIAKQLSTLRTFLSYAKKNGITVDDNYKNFRITRKPLPVIALTNDELEKLLNVDLGDYEKRIKSYTIKGETISYSTLDKVRDIFCFGCVTGLRYSDLNALKWNNINNNEIRIVVTKTKDPLTIPLNQYSSRILQKYANYLRPLPTMSNQKINRYIKELCKYVGIDEDTEIVRFKGSERIDKTYKKYELVSAHTARKTFCTLSLERGMSAEEVMKISGHQSYQSFQRYVNVTEERKRNVMRNAWGVPGNIVKLKSVGGER